MAFYRAYFLHMQLFGNCVGVCHADLQQTGLNSAMAQEKGRTLGIFFMIRGDGSGLCDPQHTKKNEVKRAVLHFTGGYRVWLHPITPYPYACRRLILPA